MRITGEQPRRISLRILVSRWVVFSFFMCLFVIFLYAVGSVQGFMDETQVFLLNLASFLSLFLSAGAVFGFAQALFFFFRKGSPDSGSKPSRQGLLRIAAYAFLMILGILAALTAVLIIAASGGDIA